MSPTSPAAAFSAERRRLSTPPSVRRRSGPIGVSKKRLSAGGQSAPLQPQPQLVQLNLDFGQSGLGMATCSGCGMVYSVGNKSDAIRHAKFHASRRSSLSGSTAAAAHTTNSSSASSSSGSTSSAALLNGVWRGQQTVKQFFNGDRIVKVSPAAGWQRAKEVFRVMDEELGQGTEPDAYSGMLVLLYVRHQSGIVGCLIAEPIRSAYRLLAPRDGADSATEREIEPRPAQCGIHKIWCHSGHRRSGVATALLDAARANLYLGILVPPAMLAFTAPTPSGYRLACRYLGTDRPLVY